MNNQQLAIEGKLRYDPMDKCSIDLCRILPLLSQQTTHPTVFAVTLSDIPITILFAAARAGSDGPIRSHFFQEIVRQSSFAQDIETLHHALFQDDLRATIPRDPREYGTSKYKAAVTNDAARLFALSGLMRAASNVIPLTLAFIDEWSDTLAGVDVLAGCSSMAETSPFAEQDEEIMNISLALLNGLDTKDKYQLVLAMSNYFSIQDGSLRVICSEKFVVHKELFDTRKQERLQQTKPVIPDSAMAPWKGILSSTS